MNALEGFGEFKFEGDGVDTTDYFIRPQIFFPSFPPPQPNV